MGESLDVEGQATSWRTGFNSVSEPAGNGHQGRMGALFVLDLTDSAPPVPRWITAWV
jgi:hypothetical protein